MSAFQVREENNCCTFRVRVQPKSRRNEITGLYGDALRIRLTAPPSDGKANRALCKFLSGKLGVAPSDVEILTGHTSRQKRVRVTGTSAAAVRAMVEKEG